jgi:hypothetical protein
LSRRDLLDKLMEELGASEKTIEDRLKDISTNKIPLQNQNGVECCLEKDKREKSMKYLLLPTEHRNYDPE